METESGAEYISQTHVRHIMRYVKACQFIGKDFVVLDAACGTGYGSRILREHCHTVIGADNNKKALTEAIKNKPMGCIFREVDLLDGICELPIDTIVSIETIEHFSKNDGLKVLSNFHKWLPKDGELIITTPYCIKSGKSPITKQHLHEFSLTDLEITLNDAGFAVQTIYPERHEGKAGRLGYCMVHCVAR